jgi:hypothetical protein
MSGYRRRRYADRRRVFRFYSSCHGGSNERFRLIASVDNSGAEGESTRRYSRGLLREFHAPQEVLEARVGAVGRLPYALLPTCTRLHLTPLDGQVCEIYLTSFI